MLLNFDMTLPKWVTEIKWSTPQPRMETVQTQQNLGSKDGDNFLIVNYVAKMEATCKKLEAVPHPKLPSFKHKVRFLFLLYSMPPYLQTLICNL